MTIDLAKLGRRVRVSNMKASMASCNEVTPRTRREPSANEREAVYHPYGYHLAACFHDKLYIVPCSACSRTRNEALDNLSKLLNKIKTTKA
jgi:hypothetical protein